MALPPNPCCHQIQVPIPLRLLVGDRKPPPTVSRGPYTTAQLLAQQRGGRTVSKSPLWPQSQHRSELSARTEPAARHCAAHEEHNTLHVKTTTIPGTNEQPKACPCSIPVESSTKPAQQQIGKHEAPQAATALVTPLQSLPGSWSTPALADLGITKPHVPSRADSNREGHIPAAPLQHQVLTDFEQTSSDRQGKDS